MECAFGFPLLSCRGYAACAVGFSFLGIPVCLTPVFSPRVWTSQCMAIRESPSWWPLSRSLALSPSGVLCGICRATSLRTDGLFYPATACGALCLSSRACSRARAVSSITWCPSRGASTCCAPLGAGPAFASCRLRPRIAWPGGVAVFAAME